MDLEIGDHLVDKTGKEYKLIEERTHQPATNKFVKEFNCQRLTDMRTMWIDVETIEKVCTKL